MSCALLLLLLGILPCAVRADQNGAANAISDAKQQILICFDAVRETEAAGANITELTGVLNEAGLLLSQAEFAFSKGDYTTAQDYAVQSQSELVNIVEDANALLLPAVAEQSQDFLINVVGSTFGTIGVLLGSWSLWIFLKKRSGDHGGKTVGSVAV